jgi:hypothetical protein
MEYSPDTYPYRLANAVFEYTACIPPLFMDLTECNHILGQCLIDLPEPDHPMPTVNMVEIRQIRENLLSIIPEESTGSTESNGTSYTRTFIDPYG